MKFYRIFISINQKIVIFLFIWWLRLFYKVQKKEKIKKGKLPLVIVANHVSLWDNFIILSSLGLFSARNTWRIPTAKTYYQKFFYRIFFKSVGTYLIEPKGEILKSIEESVNNLKEGYSMIFFPEGRIAELGQRGAAKKGIGFLVKEVRVNIVPVYIKHPGKKFSGLFATLKNTGVIIGKMIDSEYFTTNYNDDIRPEKILDEVWKLNK